MSGKRVTYDGITYDSQLEASRHAVLMAWQNQGIISGLRYHPTYTLQEEFTHPSYGKVEAVTWEADFCYQQHLEPFLYIVEDVKGYPHPTFRTKLPFILHYFATTHIFISKHQNDWYEGDRSRLPPVRRKRRR